MLVAFPIVTDGRFANCGSLRDNSEDLALPAPFGREVREACDPEAVRQTAIDGGLDDVGCQERQRYGHIDFAHAACRAFGDAVGRGRAIIDEFLEPAAPLRNGSNQRPFCIRAHWTRLLRG